MRNTIHQKNGAERNFIELTNLNIPLDILLNSFHMSCLSLKTLKTIWYLRKSPILKLYPYFSYAAFVAWYG